ncbi:hypothetical protein [Bradyrhizobium sp.]|uniref:hypothetical protein n=1 Tax=Bradyrhizobium sp. TaxID=376 RepID=UPI003C70894D
MRRSSFIAGVVALVSVPAGIALAQSAPNAGTGATTAPAATTAPVATTTTPAATSAATATEPAAPKKKKKTVKMTRQQEIDKSIESGTVPARYRRSVPKQYQQYIPFEKQ